MPQLKEFGLDESVVAKRIYRDYSHQTTRAGLVVEKEIRDELHSFLSSFLDFVGSDHSVFLRVDAFAAASVLNIVEINVELQDGWGVALNLLRASGNTPYFNGSTRLPTEIILYREDYLPEFELAQQELALLGHQLEIVGWRTRPGVGAKGAFDSKMYLAKFSQTWCGKRVCVPKTYIADTTPWGDLPQDVVFKFCDKYGKPARKARYSVARRHEIGHGKFMRKCYLAGEAIAQEYIEPLRLENGASTQAIVLCSGCNPLVGYTQVAPPGVFIINDRTAKKGALVFG